MASKLNFDDDLSLFKDYLAEFDSSIPFDNEICPTCGIKLSDSLKISNSPYVLYKSVNEEIKLNGIINTLKAINSPYKIEKRLDQNSKTAILYIFDVFVPMNFIVTAIKNEE